MKRLRGSGTHNSPMNRDKLPLRPNTVHGGSGRPKGVVHEAPTRPMINDQNYAAQKVKKRK